MGKLIEATKALSEEMVSNNYHGSSDRANLKTSGGKYDIDAVDIVASKADVLAQQFDQLGAHAPRCPFS